jgi:hypothetical protein
MGKISFTDEHIITAFSFGGCIFLTFLIFMTVAILMLDRDATELIARYRHDIRRAIETGTVEGSRIASQLDLVDLWRTNNAKSLNDIRADIPPEDLGTFGLE